MLLRDSSVRFALLTAAVAAAVACTAYSDSAPGDGITPGDGGDDSGGTSSTGAAPGKGGNLNLGAMDTGGCDPGTDECGMGQPLFEAFCSDNQAIVKPRTSDSQ